MERTDVTVIGGGLLGCAAAYFLSANGAAVTLIEKGQLNRQASGQNAGSLHFQLEHRAIEYDDRLAEQFAVSIPLNLEAERSWKELERELGEDMEVVQEGGLVVAETDEEVALLERKQRIEHRWGLATELITGDEARAIAPYLSRNVKAAGFYAGEGHANPRLAAPAFARGALRRGARIRTETKVIALTRKGFRWHLSVSTGEELSADAVLVASGAWTGEVLGLANVNLPVIPVALSMIATEAVAPVLRHLVQHVNRRLSMKQVRDGNVLIGGGWPSWLKRKGAAVDLDASPDLVFESLPGNAATALRVAPAIGSLQMIRAWSGLVGVTPDQVPALGEIRRRPGLFVAIGGAAFTLGPVFARHLTEKMKGGADAALDLYDPVRFDHLNPV